MPENTSAIWSSYLRCMEIHTTTRYRFFVDSSSTNKAFLCRRGSLFVSCRSHGFNLAAKDILTSHDDVINKVQEPKQKLSLHIYATTLRKSTSLWARTANATRWNSTYVMLSRCVGFWEFILQINMPDLSQLLPSEVKDEAVDAPLKKLHDLDSVTMALQDESVI